MVAWDTHSINQMQFQSYCISRGNAASLTSHRAVAPARSVVGMVITAAVVYQTMPPTAITKFSLGLVSFISLLVQMKSTHMAVGKYHNTNSMRAAWNVHHLHSVYMYVLPVQCTYTCLISKTSLQSTDTQAHQACLWGWTRQKLTSLQCHTKWQLVQRYLVLS